MKNWKQWIVIVLIVTVPFSQSFASRWQMRTVLNTLHSEFASARSERERRDAAQRFVKNLHEIESSGTSRNELLQELKSLALDHQTEARLEALISGVTSGVLSQDEYLAEALSIAKATEATGAAYSGSDERGIIIGSAIFVVVLAVLTMVTYREPTDCNLNYYGYLYCTY